MKTKYLLFIFAFSFIWSCDKEEIALFESEEAGIYFQRVSSWIVGGAENYTDSISVSLSGWSSSITTYTVNVGIKTMGKQCDYDRPVKVSIDPERTTAIEGVHFEVKTDTIAVKAGTSSVNVPVRILRTADLTENVYDIALKLEDNEHFKCLLPTYKNTNSYTSTGKQIYGNKFIMSISELYSAPRYWGTASAYFGEWSAQKYIVVNTVCGWTTTDWNNAAYSGQKIQLGRLSFAAKQVQHYLQEMADNGTPVRESDGSFMILNDTYPVDYSDYE